MEVNKQKLVPAYKGLLKANQPLLCPLYSGQGTLLAEKGVVLNDEQVLRIKNHGALFTYKSELLAALEDSRLSLDGRGVPATKEYVPAPMGFDGWHSIEKAVSALLATPPPDKPFDQTTYALVKRIQMLCERNRDEAISRIFIEFDNACLARHAINVAVICFLCTDFMGWDEKRIQALMSAALTMNISLREQAQNILLPVTGGDPAQNTVLEQHPAESEKVLRGRGVSEESWLSLVRKHHELADGTGFPDHIGEDDLSWGDHVLSLCDQYCMMVMGMHNEAAVYPHIAITEALTHFAGRYRKVLSKALLKTVGLYPPGCLVRLESNEIAMIVANGKKVDAPKVKVVVDSYGNILSSPVMRWAGSGPTAIADVVHSNAIINQLKLFA